MLILDDIIQHLYIISYIKHNQLSNKNEYQISWTIKNNKRDRYAYTCIILNFKLCSMQMFNFNCL